MSERCTCTKVEGCRVAQKRPPSWLTARNSCFSLQLSSRFADIRPDLRSSKRQSSRHLVALSSSLKESAGAYDCHTLVHDPLADPEVAVNPPFDFFALGELVALQTGAAMPGDAKRLVERKYPSETADSRGWRKMDRGRGRPLKGKGAAYVSPVDRLTPARKAETVEWQISMV